MVLNALSGVKYVSGSWTLISGSPLEVLSSLGYLERVMPENIGPFFSSGTEFYVYYWNGSPRIRAGM